MQNHVVLQTDYTKPVIDNDGKVFYPFSSGVVVDDKSSGLKPEIGKSGFVEHDVNQTLSGIQFDKNGNVVKNTYKESPSVKDEAQEFNYIKSHLYYQMEKEERNHMNQLMNKYYIWNKWR